MGGGVADPAKSTKWDECVDMHEKHEPTKEKYVKAAGPIDAIKAKIVAGGARDDPSYFLPSRSRVIFMVTPVLRRSRRRARNYAELRTLLPPAGGQLPKAQIPASPVRPVQRGITVLHQSPDGRDEASPPHHNSSLVSQCVSPTCRPGASRRTDHSASIMGKDLGVDAQDCRQGLTHMQARASEEWS